jgi:hypothetical protein
VVVVMRLHTALASCVVSIFLYFLLPFSLLQEPDFPTYCGFFFPFFLYLLVFPVHAVNSGAGVAPPSS